MKRTSFGSVDWDSHSLGNSLHHQEKAEKKKEREKEDIKTISNRIKQREIGEERHLSRPLCVQRNGRTPSKRWECVPLGRRLGILRPYRTGTIIWIVGDCESDDVVLHNSQDEVRTVELQNQLSNAIL